jgi:hypothetical protein
MLRRNAPGDEQQAGFDHELSLLVDGTHHENRTATQCQDAFLGSLRLNATTSASSGSWRHSGICCTITACGASVDAG